MSSNKHSSSMHALPLFFALLFSLSTLSISEAHQKHLRGFTIDLIHRHSPLSPFYNSSMTQSDLIRDAALRSISRSNRFQHLSEFGSELVETDIIPNSSNYLMRVFIGTPPVERLAIADTGSDLIWVQCSPCSNCYPQNAPLFDPTKSSTYTDLSCYSRACAFLPEGYYGCGRSNQCIYYYTYGDMSYTNGVLAQDFINFGTSGDQSTSFPKSVFGCGRNNGGTFGSTETGLVGLGNGNLSLVSQLGAQIGRKFSYCLVPFFSNTQSKLKFGQVATISGNGIVSTPLIIKPAPLSNFYYLNLEGITVGQRTVQTGQRNGNIVIDSGTTLTMLPRNFYNNVEALVEQAIVVQPVQNPPNPFKLCYPNASLASNNINFPTFVVHFTGASLSLNPENLYLRQNNLICFAVVPTEGLSLYGNVAQFNFKVEHDLPGRKIRFAPADCTRP